MGKIETRPNYHYWQENGLFWVEEYSRRKKTQVFFDIQEFIIAEYFARSAPARVLEYGCGTGRHLRYLKDIPGIEIYGYDQSPTMLEGVRQWADETWFKEHVTLGKPITHLPYKDKSFDVVFTAEVLIHICPADLPAILTEFLRISKWQVFHLEPAPDFIVAPEEHNGCWNHDLIKEYASLGYSCEILPKGYHAQSPYRVIIDSSRTLPQQIISMSKLRELESDIQPTLNIGSNCELEIEQIQSQFLEELKKKENWTNELETYRDFLLEELKKKENRITELENRQNQMSIDLNDKTKKISNMEKTWFYRLKSLVKRK